MRESTPVEPSRRIGKLVHGNPSHEDYLQRWAELYEDMNYNQGLAGYFLQKSHAWAEQRWGPEIHFGKVLEVGAGTGVHIEHVRHSFDQYVMTDLNPPLMNRIDGVHGRVGGAISTEIQDATSLSYDGESFDRVIAAHVLEHLPNPHDVLLEWTRVLKPGGVLTLVLPCDPGLAWRLGRYGFARKKFIKAGIDYDYWMAREHINAINNLVSFTRHFFPRMKEQWLPFRIPSMDLNLFYIAHIEV